jgi:hypothetical protein
MVRGPAGQYRQYRSVQNRGHSGRRMAHSRILRSVVCFTHENELEGRPVFPRVTVFKALSKVEELGYAT